MTHDERWMAGYNEWVAFIEREHRNPSKFIPEERGFRNWVRHQQKLMNAGELRPERVEMFKQLLETGEKYKHVNQWG